MKSPGFTPLLLAAALAALALALPAALVVWRRRRRVGDEPICRRCGYDLRGRGEGSTVCPECGADLSLPHAIQIGHYHKRAWPMPLACIAALTLLAMAGRIGAQWVRNFNWLPYESFSTVLAAAKPPLGDADALDELNRRAQGDLFKGEQISTAYAAAMTELAKWPPFNYGWGRLVEALHDFGHLSDGDWERYVASLVAFKIRLPTEVRSHRPPTLSIDVSFNGGRGAVRVKGDWKMLAVRVDGEPVKDAAIGSGIFDFTESSSSSGSSTGNLNAVNTAGKKRVEVSLEFNENAPPGPAAATRPSLALGHTVHRVITLTADMDVVAPQVAAPAAVAAARPAMSAGLTATVGKNRGANELSIMAGDLPFRVAAMLQLSSGNHAVQGFSEHSLFSSARDKHGWVFELPPDCPEIFDVLLRPVPQDDDFGSDPSPPWPEAIVIRGIHLPPAATQPAAPQPAAAPPRMK